jgi:hypothetical protein
MKAHTVMAIGENQVVEGKRTMDVVAIEEEKVFEFAGSVQEWGEYQLL